MKKLQLIIIATALIFVFSCNYQPLKNEGKVIHMDNIVDLTHTLTADFPFIPVKKFTYPF